MKILSIETSCDETAASVVDIKGSPTSPTISILGNALFSQIKIHEEFGGVFPALAKREHIKNLPPLLYKALKEAKLLKQSKEVQISNTQKKKLDTFLAREDGAADALYSLFSHTKKPALDAVAVTQGPGLEPALWVGINIAVALGKIWDIPVIPVNHMEGHIFSVLFAKTKNLKPKTLNFPILSLLISGGHTELVYSLKLLKYKILGQTRDDAIGEAYDKVARMIGLPYPGGPEIARLAEKCRKKKTVSTTWSFPRPMMYSKDLDFSFSGLKTSVLYATQNKTLSDTDREEIAKEFEDAVTDVIIHKTRKALEQFPSRTLIVAGGVAANKHIKKNIEIMAKEFSDLSVFFPIRELSTDNGVMIGIAAFEHIIANPKKLKQKTDLKAVGNLHLS
jgi:N6-L-threonylcarbamoyladenine synthase